MNTVPAPQRILVVDDDEHVRTLLVMALMRAGYTVSIGMDGVEGLAMLRTNDYDLLISDNQMPRLTGLEMIKQMHAEKIRLPIIMATGILQPKDLVNLELPPLKLLAKPYQLTDLLALVKTTLTADGTSRAGGNP